MSSVPRDLSSRSSRRRHTSASNRSHKKLDSVTAAETRRETRSARQKCPYCDHLISYTNLARHKREKRHDVDLVGEAFSRRSGNSCATCQKSYTRRGSLLRHCNRNRDHEPFSSASVAETSMESMMPTSGSELDATPFITPEPSSTPDFTHKKLEMPESAVPFMDMDYLSGASASSQVDMYPGSQNLDGSQEVEPRTGTNYRTQEVVHARLSGRYDCVSPQMPANVALQLLPVNIGVFNNYCPSPTPIEVYHQTQNLSRNHGTFDHEAVVETGLVSHRRYSYPDETNNLHPHSHTHTSDIPITGALDDFSHIDVQSAASWVFHPFSHYPPSPHSFQTRTD